MTMLFEVSQHDMWLCILIITYSIGLIYTTYETLTTMMKDKVFSEPEFYGLNPYVMGLVFSSLMAIWPIMFLSAKIIKLFGGKK